LLVYLSSEKEIGSKPITKLLYIFWVYFFICKLFQFLKKSMFPFSCSFSFFCVFFKLFFKKFINLSIFMFICDYIILGFFVLSCFVGFLCLFCFSTSSFPPIVLFNYKPWIVQLNPIHCLWCIMFKIAMGVVFVFVMVVTLIKMAPHTRLE